MKLTLHEDKFIEELKQIELSNTDIIRRANLSISLCRKTILKFKKDIIKNGFSSIKEEIDFFKHTKQIPLYKLIYYSEIRSFEIQFPKANISSQNKFIKKKINKLNRFFLYNMDFGQYIISGQTYLDEHYFTRKYFEAFPITSSKFYLQDPEFCTARSMLLGKFKAYGILTVYLKNRLSNMSEFNSENSILVGNKMNLKWTSTKSALTELIYALHYNRVINNGNTDIKEIALALQKVLNFDLGDFYKTFSEIKSRKLSRTKFLDDLSIGLLTHMDRLED